MVDSYPDRAAASLGEIIRRQRELAALPMRQLAQMVGISNPYLSQIERGLRAPSDHVLEAIARSLQTTSQMLVEAAAGASAAEGQGEAGESAVLAAIKDDPLLTASQRQALTETYLAFTEVTLARRRRRGRPPSGGRAEPGSDTQDPDEQQARNP